MPADEPRQIPFSVIDEAVHLLDTPMEPWSIEVELSFPGRIDEHRLRKAVTEAAVNHAMVRARQCPARLSDRQFTWEIGPDLDLDSVRVVDCPDDAGADAERVRLQSISVPLVESPPFRLLVARGPDGDSLMMNVNHAAFDGFGTLRFLQAVGRAYTGGTDPLPSVPFDEARDVEGHLDTDDARARAARLRDLGEKFTDLVRPPARLAVEGGEPAPGYGFHHVQLSPTETEALKSSAEDPVTVNDLLLAALTLAIETWNTDHRKTSGRIGILVPVNLRPKEWQADIVTNFVLDTRVSTGPGDRRDDEALLEAISGRTSRIKRWGAGAALMEVLGLSPYLPLWAKSPVSPLLWITGHRLVDTAVLSNLGAVSELPQFGPEAGEVQAVWFSAPTRMPCGLSLGAASVGGRLCLSFRYRRPQFGPDAARLFADLFLFELSRLTA
ncbi:MAG: hypothetical protein M3179_14910 [Actinomycetota bacterium]|nr:hypothetical protein [Actinomycetota bacterium]